MARPGVVGVQPRGLKCRGEYPELPRDREPSGHGEILGHSTGQPTRTQVFQWI